MKLGRGWMEATHARTSDQDAAVEPALSVQSAGDARGDTQGWGNFCRYLELREPDPLHPVRHGENFVGIRPQLSALAFVQLIAAITLTPICCFRC
jgi:hypothetical protein